MFGGAEFAEDSFVGGAGEEDAETAASIALSMYYQAAGVAGEDDYSASLNPREYMDYEGGRHLCCTIREASTYMCLFVCG